MRPSRLALIAALALIVPLLTDTAAETPAAAHGAVHTLPATPAKPLAVGARKLRSAPRRSFIDNFSGNRGARPNRALWVAETGGGGWGNNELETYTSSTKNASLDGRGHLRISAIRETTTGKDGITRNYTSARLNSRVSVQYGTIEARIKLPSGAGLWPAFWTLGSDISKVGWPRCGEIDIMEALNSMQTVYGTVHGPDGKQDWTAFGLGGTVTTSSTFANTWHVYGVRWARDTITWTLDGHAFRTIHRTDMASGSTWAANKPHHLLLNVAVGGWPGNPDSTTFAKGPQSMFVDWVRASHAV